MAESSDPLFSDADMLVRQFQRVEGMWAGLADALGVAPDFDPSRPDDLSRCFAARNPQERADLERQLLAILDDAHVLRGQMQQTQDAMMRKMERATAYHVAANLYHRRSGAR